MDEVYNICFFFFQFFVSLLRSFSHFLPLLGYFFVWTCSHKRLTLQNNRWSNFRRIGEANETSQWKTKWVQVVFRAFACSFSFPICPYSSIYPSVCPSIYPSNSLRLMPSLACSWDHVFSPLFQRPSCYQGPQPACSSMLESPCWGQEWRKCERKKNGACLVMGLAR